MKNYLNETFDAEIFGFQAVMSDIDTLITSAERIEGLRLNYPGGFQGLSTVPVIAGFQGNSFHLSIPYRASNGGDSTSNHLFSGNGFTATVRANAIPQLVLPRRGARLHDGSQLCTVDNQGNGVLVATLQSSPGCLPRVTARFLGPSGFDWSARHDIGERRSN